MKCVGFKRMWHGRHEGIGNALLIACNAGGPDVIALRYSDPRQLLDNSETTHDRAGIDTATDFFPGARCWASHTGTGNDGFWDNEGGVSGIRSSIGIVLTCP